MSGKPTTVVLKKTQASNREYVEDRAKRMVDASDGGACIYYEIESPGSGPEFLMGFGTVAGETEKLVKHFESKGKRVPMVRILVLIEGDDEAKREASNRIDNAPLQA